MFILGVATLAHAARRVPTLALFPLRVAWSVDLPLIAAPAVFDRYRAFLPLADGQLSAYDLRNGAHLWTVPARTTAQPSTDGTYVFVVDGQIATALLADTGEERWRIQLAGTPATTPTAQSGWLLVTLSSGTLAALRVADGAQVWMRELGASIVVPPTIDGDRVCVPLSDGRVVSLAMVNGQVQWERRLGGPGTHIVARHQRLYLGSADNYFYALESSTGAVAWRWRTGADIVGAPVVDDDRVYFVSLDNVVRALDHRSGAQRWRRALASRPSDGPVLAGDTLFVPNLPGTGFGFLTRDGGPAGNLETLAPLAAPFQVVEPPIVSLPHVVRLIRSLVGARMTAFVRDVEPTLAPAVAPLPNAVPVVPPGEDAAASETSTPVAPGAPGEGTSPERHR